MTIEVLRTIAHFRNLPEDVLVRLAQGFAERTLAAGESLYEAREPADALFVVTSGTVVVFRGRPGEESRPMARLCNGDLAGTADLFDSDRHSETARALEDSVVLRGDKDELLRLLADHPQEVLNLQLAAARDLTARAKLSLAIAHRRAVRHRVNRNARLIPVGSGAVRPTLVDLSPYGMALRGAPESWQPDLVVEFRLEWGSQRLDFVGRVAWREGDQLGIDLEEPSPGLQAEIERMLESMLRSQV